MTARQRQLEAQTLEAERAGEQAADTHVALQARLPACSASRTHAQPATCPMLLTATRVALQAQIHAQQALTLTLTRRRSMRSRP